ncbi:Rieske (2Fe-2S) iron-sulfur domain-containing protein [Actinobacteria bacterium OK074]|nr:Rieske (2Fe-2S) iron-sulfur domain-containing protein [Actinobacteria bacterium OK074]
MTTRRTVLAAGTAAALTAGCSQYGDSGGDTGPAASAGTELAATGDIPVGGGKIFKDEKVVVTQPTRGEFKAFSAVCTHAGCTVAEVKDGTIRCPCHGSRFRVADGSVAGGPAPSPLPSEKIEVTGNSITLA